MSKQHDVRGPLFDILEAANFTKGMTLASFESKPPALFAVQHQLMVIGEATKRIPSLIEKLDMIFKSLK